MTEPYKPTAPDITHDEIVGALGSGYDLWLAKEAIRIGELGIAQQNSNLQAMESRAASLLGWLAPMIVALAGAALKLEWRLLACATIVPLILSAICCVAALWPKDWGYPSYTITDMQGWSVSTELETQERLALAYERTIQAQGKGLMRFSRWLTAAWIFLFLAPLAALCVLVTAISSLAGV